MNDFKVDGKVDWKAYRAAEIANGYRCSKCDAYIFRGCGYKQECSSCKDLLLPEEIRHEDIIRCPYCKHEEFVCHTECYELYEDGDHSFSCSNCEKEYEISTWVSYSFKSPPLIE